MPSRAPADTISLVASLIGQRAELLSRCDTVGDPLDAPGGDDARLAELTSALDDLLSHGHRVRYLDPACSPHDDALAERLADAEPVNPPATRAELERRFAADRRVVLIEHPSLPGRPINVLWVALCDGSPTTLDRILDPKSPVIDPFGADTAVFYSIWNAEAGLAGLGRGRELLEGAMELIREDFHGLETLTTLSPIPGFRTWADPLDSDTDALSLCARYLTAQGADGRLLDPVARFHMGNGARLWRVLRGADDSPRGLERSFGIMANYRYFPEDLEANRRSLTEGSPALGQVVTALLGGD